MSDLENNTENLTHSLSPLDEYWEKFLKETGRSSDERCSGDLDFESSGFTNDSQVASILAGKKTAFFSSYQTFAIDNEMLPVSGELYLVLDRGGNPACVIEIESVAVIPFGEVTWEMAEKEGQDQNISEWRERTREAMEDECAVTGGQFSENMNLVFQCFRVVYR